MVTHPFMALSDLLAVYLVASACAAGGALFVGLSSPLGLRLSWGQ